MSTEHLPSPKPEERQPALYPLQEMVDAFADEFVQHIIGSERSNAASLLRQIIDRAYDQGGEDMYEAVQSLDIKKEITIDRSHIKEALKLFLRTQGKASLSRQEVTEIDSIAHNIEIEFSSPPLPPLNELRQQEKLNEGISNLLPSLRKFRNS